MKRLVLFSLLLLPAAALGQSPEAQILLARSAIESGRTTGGVDSLLAARARLDLAHRGATGETAAWAGYYAARADLHIGEAFYETDPDRAREHLDRAIETLDALILEEPEHAEAIGMLSAVVGMRVGLDPERLAMSLGPRVGALSQRALRLDAENPRAQLFRGVALASTPPEWGGDPEGALVAFGLAIERFAEAEPEGLEPTWGLADVYAWIGMQHLMQGQTVPAREAFEAGLQVQPGFGWIQSMMPWLEGIEAQQNG